MSPDRLAAAHRFLTEAVDAPETAAGPGATADARLSALTVCEAVTRRLDRISVATTAALDRDGTFTERGYRNATLALTGLLGYDRAEARRRTSAADHVQPRTGVDGSELPPKLPATQEVAPRLELTDFRVAERSITWSRRNPGSGIHHCLGAPLARAEAEIVLTALITRFPRLRLADAGFVPEPVPGLRIRGLRSLPVVVDRPGIRPGDVA